MDAAIEDDGSMELQRISAKLQEGGLSMDSTDEQRMSYLWKLYIKTEVQLKAELKSIEQLRTQQDGEMKEVENYMEHIRSLSDEREALTLEFEAENEQLKAQLDSLQNELHKAQFNEETKAMLLQQGLDDIVDGSTSEQIAFLLVERARLMDELEAEQNHATSEDAADNLDTNIKDLRRMLEQERQEFEEELQQQHALLRKTKEQMRMAHEDEMTNMMEENEQLQDMLNEAKQRVVSCQNEIEELKDTMKRDSSGTEDAGKKMQLDTSSSSHEEEIQSLMSQLTVLRQENGTLRTKISELNEQLSNEEESHDDKLEERDNTIQKLRNEIDRQQLYITELQTAITRGKSERKSLEIQLNIAEQEREDLQMKQRHISTAVKKPQSDDEVDLREKELSQVKEKNDALEHRIETLQDEIEAKCAMISSVQSKLEEAERQVVCKERLQEENKQQRITISELQDSVSTLNDRLGVVQKEAEKKNSANTQKWKHDLDASERSLQVARQELASVKSQHAGCIAQQNKDKELNNSLRTELSQLQRRATALEKTKEQANLANEALQQQLIDCKMRDTKAGSDEKEQLLQLQADLREKTAAMHRLQEQSTQDKLEKDNIAQQLRHSVEQHSRTTSELQVVEEKSRDMQQQLVEQTKQLEQLHLEQENINMLNDQLLHKQTEMKHQQSELSREAEACAVKQKETICELEKQLSETASRLADVERHLTEHRATISINEGNANRKLHELTDENTTLSTLMNGMKIEMAEMNAKHVQEVDEYKEKINSAHSECKDMTEKFEESERRAIRQSEAHNIMKEELRKTQEKVKELLEKNSELNTSNNNFKAQFEKMSEVSNEKDAMQILAENNMTRAESRAAQAEQKAHSMQQRLEMAEKQLESLSSLKTALREKEVEIENYRSLSEQESLHSAHASENVERLQQQTAALRQQERLLEGKNCELQHALLDVEAKLEAMKEQARCRSNQRQTSGERTQELSAEVSALQKQVESLRREIHQSMTKYDNQVKKYVERKLRTKLKLHNAREHYTMERDKLRSHLEKLRADLVAEKAKTSDEQQWREKTQLDNRKLVSDKRELIAQLSEAEDTRRDNERRLSLLRVRCNYLEEENRSLSEHVVSLRTRTQLVTSDWQNKMEKTQNGLDEDSRSGYDTAVVLSAS